MELVKNEVEQDGPSYPCPGCGRESRKLSGPLKSRPSPMAQTAEFCSYQCWLRHREATGQNDWKQEVAT